MFQLHAISVDKSGDGAPGASRPTGTEIRVGRETLGAPLTLRMSTGFETRRYLHERQEVRRLHFQQPKAIAATFHDPYELLINELSNGNVVIFDVESTGVNTAYDEIVQIAAVKINSQGTVIDHNAFNDVSATGEILIKILNEKVIPTTLPRAQVFLEFMPRFEIISRELSELKKKSIHMRPSELIIKIIKQSKINTDHYGPPIKGRRIRLHLPGRVTRLRIPVLLCH